MRIVNGIGHGIDGDGVRACVAGVVGVDVAGTELGASGHVGKRGVDGAEVHLEHPQRVAGLRQNHVAVGDATNGDVGIHRPNALLVHVGDPQVGRGTDGVQVSCLRPRRSSRAHAVQERGFGGRTEVGGQHAERGGRGVNDGAFCPFFGHDAQREVTRRVGGLPSVFVGFVGGSVVGCIDHISVAEVQDLIGGCTRTVDHQLQG